MQHAIDPKIDCVFKALLGAPDNRNLLIHFLNAFLAHELAQPLVWVDILNPYNDKEFVSDKLSIVDVKARDSQGQYYQIEIQLTSFGHLPGRIMYNWADIYSQQLKSGQGYDLLKPSYAIWLLAENLLKDDDDPTHHYKMRDQQGRSLGQHGGICLLELNKFDAVTISSEDQRWLKFFKDGEQLNDAALPDWMHTPEMQQAMNTLRQFSEKERQYDRYQARQEHVRQQRTLMQEREQALLREQVALQREEIALQREETALQREQTALCEVERLKALLAKKEPGAD